MIKVVGDKLLVSAVEKEEKSLSGIILGTVRKETPVPHLVESSGVSYLKKGDVVVCEPPRDTWEEEGYDSPIGFISDTKALLVRDGEDWRPLRDDILVQLRDVNRDSGGIIQLSDDGDALLKSFDVIDVGEDCKYISIGDVVVLSWMNITPPFNIHGYEKYGVTCEAEVLALLDVND